MPLTVRSYRARGPGLRPLFAAMRRRGLCIFGKSVWGNGGFHAGDGIVQEPPAGASVGTAPREGKGVVGR